MSKRDSAFCRYEHLFYVLDIFLEALVGKHQVGNRIAGVKNGRVVLSANLRSYGGQRTVADQLTTEEHCNLTGLYYLSFAAL